jgi:hypothetical protein
MAFILHEEHELDVSENKVARKILELKRIK